MLSFDLGRHLDRTRDLKTRFICFRNRVRLDENFRMPTRRPQYIRLLDFVLELSTKVWSPLPRLSWVRKYPRRWCWVNIHNWKVVQWSDQTEFSELYIPAVPLHLVSFK